MCQSCPQMSNQANFVAVDRRQLHYHDRRGRESVRDQPPIAPPTPRYAHTHEQKKNKCSTDGSKEALHDGERCVGIQAGSGSSGSTMEAYCNDYARLELQDDFLPRHGPWRKPLLEILVTWATEKRLPGEAGAVPQMLLV